MLGRTQPGMAGAPLVVMILVVASCSGGAPSSPSQTASASATLAPTQAPTRAPTPAPSLTPAAEPTSAPTQSAAPSLSPGGQIVFVDDHGAGSHLQIYIENADGSNVRHLVESNFDDNTPRFSADGRKIVFTSYRPNASYISVVNADGTGLAQIGEGEDPAWSPDGRQIVFTKNLGDPGAQVPYNVALWIMNADGTDAHQITLQGLECRGPCPQGAQDNQGVWSPDAKRIAFLRDFYTTPEQYVIFTVAVDGSDLQRVSPEGMNVGNPAWSPDGTLIAFQSPPEPVSSGEQNIYTIRPDGTGLTQLTSHLSSDAHGAQGVFHPTWSPDGAKIAFSHYPGALPDRAALFVMNADGTDVHLLAPTQLNENAASWGRSPAD